MSLLNKESEDEYDNNIHIVNPFVHKLRLENTFDKFKVRAQHNLHFAYLKIKKTYCDM